MQSELARVRTTAPKGSEDLAQGEELHPLKYSFDACDHSYAHWTLTRTFEATWNSIFGVLAPLMINEATDYGLKKAMGNFASDQNKTELDKEDFLLDKKLSDFKLNDTDWQTIKVQLRALGLIAKSEKTRSIKDTQTYWTLTPFGDERMTRLRAIKRGMPPKAKPKVTKKKES